MLKFYMLFAALFLFSAASAQELYVTPFTYQSGTNTPGYQVIGGFLLRTDTGAAFMATAKKSSILKDGVRENYLSLPGGIGLNVRDVVLSLHIGPIWLEKELGVIGGMQFMHLLPINNRISSVITVDANTSSFYKHEFVVSMGFAWKMFNSKK